MYALEFLPDGGLIFTMRKLSGLTLGEALRRDQAGDAQPAIATVNAVVTLALRVCDALSRAHHLGIVHRDLKPDNIMLGADGEVALVDWGECRLLSEPDTGPAGSTVGTPAYMSPEQARGEPADQRSDVYGVAATFWHVLTRQYPTWDTDPERFWERKRHGELDPLTPAATRRVPCRLLAILQRALTADPTGRYPSVRALADDLERFQGGQAVEAYAESALERAGRWLTRQRGPLLAAAIILSVAGAAAWLLWREHQRQIGEWGEPILVEDFADDGWRSRWTAAPADAFKAHLDGVMTVNDSFSFLLLNRPLSGAVAIEYDGWYAPEARPGDLSVVWHEDPDLLQHPHSLLSDKDKPAGYWLQAGSYANNFCSLFRWPDKVRLDKSPLRLNPAEHHHFRAELDGRHLRLWVDGALTLEHEAMLPISTGHIGLYGFFPGKIFSQVRVYQKHLPEVAPITLGADTLLDRRMYTAAAEEYAKVVASHAGHPLATEARYRQGLAIWLDGRRDEAETVWRGLPPGEQADQAAAHHLDRVFADGRIAAACSGLVALYHRTPTVDGQLRQQWAAWAQTAIRADWSQTRPDDTTSIVEACLRAFPKAGGTAEECAQLLNALGRHAETALAFPDELTPTTFALMRLGRTREAQARFGHTPWLKFMIERDLGDLPALLDDPATTLAMRTEILIDTGRAEAALDLGPPGALALLALGRPDEALADPAISHDGRLNGLWQLGRIGEALQLAEHRDPNRLEQLRLLAGIAPNERAGLASGPRLGWEMVAAASDGDAERLGRLGQKLQQVWPDWERWIPRLVVEPVIAAHRGDKTMLRQRLTEAWPAVREVREVRGQRPWHLAGYVLGGLDAEAVRHMPCASEADLWLAVGDALRAELAGEPSAALWRRYLDLPPHLRAPRGLPDPGLERLAQWLSDPPAPAPAH